MKQQIEKAQQINDLADSTSSVLDGSGVNEARTGAKSDASLTHSSSLPVLINALARARRGHKAPHLVTTLIEQCKNFDRNPDAMRPMILKTIEHIEAA